MINGTADLGIPTVHSTSLVLQFFVFVFVLSFFLVCLNRPCARAAELGYSVEYEYLTCLQASRRGEFKEDLWN